MNPRRDALLVVGHGSRDGDGVAECGTLVNHLRTLRPDLPLSLGFIELSPPPIHQAVAGLVAGGATNVTVVPLVLLGAGHAKTDVPAAIQRVRRTYSEVTFRYAAPLGVHPDLLTIVDERLHSVLPISGRRDTAVLLIGRGSSDPDANADLAKVARLVWEGRGFQAVEFAFVGITNPRVEAGLERCRRLGAKRIAVVPYFLFTGVLVRRIHALAHTFAAANPDLEVLVTSHLGADRRIAKLVLGRFDQAREGLVQPNCDLCQYRVPLPGFEERVGAPQTLHHHPHDPATDVLCGGNRR
ncbi:MAG: sirohydrochlorin chelatase [Actinomycetota bacterium]|nr:sirohydrochlorin chelatase [Actinomycetota bacterium]